MNSILYPRLLDGAARELHRRHAHTPVRELGRRAAIEHPAAVFASTGGRRVRRDELRGLRDRVVRSAERAGFPGEGRRADRAAFDLEVAQILHQDAGLVAAEASVRSIWAFMALVLLPDVSYWRFPAPPADRVIGTDITRHVLGRLWWRAHLLAVPGGVDSYRLLDSFGEAAFDQIFARRRSLGGSRVLVRSLAEAWPYLDTGAVNERELLRDVLKRLLRSSAIVEFEALDGDELRRQISVAAAEAVAAMQVEGRVGGGQRAQGGS